MKYTKGELLDAFCRAERYEEGSETKMQFLKRKEKEWAVSRAKAQLLMEAQDTALEEVRGKGADVEL